MWLGHTGLLQYTDLVCECKGGGGGSVQRVMHVVWGSGAPRRSRLPLWALSPHAKVPEGSAGGGGCASSSCCSAEIPFLLLPVLRGGLFVLSVFLVRFVTMVLAVVLVVVMVSPHPV